MCAPQMQQGKAEYDPMGSLGAYRTLGDHRRAGFPAPQIEAMAFWSGCHGAFRERWRLFGAPIDRYAISVTDGANLSVESLSRATFGSAARGRRQGRVCRSEEHTSELQSLMRISYAVFCLKK